MRTSVRNAAGDRFRSRILLFYQEDRWLLSRLPDPRDDDDRVRYAVLALVESFNWKLRIGLRRDGSRVESGDFLTRELLEWVKGVVAIDEELNKMGQETAQHDTFKDRYHNILAPIFKRKCILNQIDYFEYEN
ncbi:hypothetical protein K440DRAFT_622546 [Wilcoxina mikolae CBS 423.85]|nr:hypothetical protein K440DRAFT_622546 [Wilcoxina mikolae CBS 423.85]